VRRGLFLLVGLALLAAGCGKSSSNSDLGKLTVAVDVPVTGSPYVAQTIRQGLLHAAGRRDRASTLTHLAVGVDAGAREHQLVFSAAALRTGFHRAMSALSRFAR